jgi:hypothetical protein
MSTKKRGRPKKIPLHESAGVPEEFMKLVQKFCCVEDKPKRDSGSIPAIKEYWCIGGVTGGNCWGGEANESVSAHDEPEYGGLDDLLLEIAPNITFLQYKKILSCEERYEYTDHEYYGNYTEYRVKYISINALYNILNTFGHVE